MKCSIMTEQQANQLNKVKTCAYSHFNQRTSNPYRINCFVCFLLSCRRSYVHIWSHRYSCGQTGNCNKEIHKHKIIKSLALLDMHLYETNKTITTANKQERASECDAIHKVTLTFDEVFPFRLFLLHFAVLFLAFFKKTGNRSEFQFILLCLRQLVDRSKCHRPISSIASAHAPKNIYGSIVYFLYNFNICEQTCVGFYQ